MEFVERIKFVEHRMKFLFRGDNLPRPSARFHALKRYSGKAPRFSTVKCESKKNNFSVFGLIWKFFPKNMNGKKWKGTF